jgi:isopenicillin N synthase-like dioxygenase
VAGIPEISLLSDNLKGDGIAGSIGAAFRTHGFCAVVDHGVDQSVIDRCFLQIEAFFSQPMESKKLYLDPTGPGIRGYTGFGIEHAKGSLRGDLKEFWHTGREISGSNGLRYGIPVNLWPTRLSGFRGAVLELFDALDRLSKRMLSYLASDLGLSRNYFEEPLSYGNSVLRAIHYPPHEDTASKAVRAAAHQDINLITLLVGANTAGLQILDQQGAWVEVDAGMDAIVCNIGDMLQRLTNGVYRSTTHRVVNPSDGVTNVSRYSMPFFVHPRTSYLIETLPQCIAGDSVDRYPGSITAGDYLQERLRENGL